MKPLISVIIPAYNAQKYIRQAVESVIQQTTDTDIEVLVIDDGSTDSTKEIVFEIQEECRSRKMDHREICYCPNEKNMGVAESRNSGIRKAGGAYIAFLDADDWWETDKIEKQLQALEASNAVLCATARELVRADGKPLDRIIEIPERIQYQALLKTNCIPCSSVLLKTEIAREFYMCHDELHEDYILWLNVLKRYGDAIGVNEPLVKCRMSEGGKSRNKLKSARMQYGVYRYIGFGRLKAFYYMIYYTVNGVRKYF